MIDVVLLYRADCPNVAAARANVAAAYAELELEPDWRELDLDDDDTPERWRGFGSPTVLVNGEDVASASACAGASCRVYEGLARAPATEKIADAIRAHRDPGAAKLSMMAAPSVALALLPSGACPSCLPAYAAALSSVGLTFLAEDRFLLPVTLAALALGVASLAFRARSRRGYGPALLATFAGVALIVGKWALDLPTLFAFACGAVLIAASAWNTWPRRRRACER